MGNETFKDRVVRNRLMHNLQIQEGDVTIEEDAQVKIVTVSQRFHNLMEEQLENVNGDDTEKDLLGGPWVILDHVLSVQKWTHGFRSYSASVQTLAVWIRFPGIAYNYYHDDLLMEVALVAGKPIKVDTSFKRLKMGSLLIGWRVAEYSVNVSCPQNRSNEVEPAKVAMVDPSEDFAAREAQVASVENIRPWMIAQGRTCRNPKPGIRDIQGPVT
ncbi:hypothetical protein Scep_016570 [Stephania cephalantha]|uniref:DUF4283 domain-containing protein n=1 Tax=Stephania cephalantha TaxID=152367 RepID=A0AAP0NSR2_9MAGN